MTANDDLDRQLTAFLREGPTDLPDPSFDAVRDRTEVTRQRVVLGPWRVPDMNRYLAVGLGAAAVVALAVVGIGLLPRSESGVGGTPSTAPSAAPSTVPSVAPSAPAPSTSAFLPEGSFVVGSTSGTPPGDGVPQITVMIPASGWSFNPEFSSLGKGEDADPPEAVVLLWAERPGTGFNVYGDPCHWESTKPATPVTTPEQLAKALSQQASRNGSTPTKTTIDGHPAWKVTLHVPNDAPDRETAFADCDQQQFASYGIEGQSGPARYHQGPGQIDEFWITEVDGSIVIIDATYRPSTPAALIEEMRDIAESATFK